MKNIFIQKSFLILLLLSLVGSLINSEIIFAESSEEFTPEKIKEYLQLSDKDAQKLMETLNQILTNKKSDLLSSENPDPRETAANEILRKGARIQVLNHLLIDAPIEVVGKIVKYAIEIAQIILAKNISLEFWEKFEKETVGKAVEYGMKAFLENEIRITPGVLKYSYSSYKGNEQEVIIQYLIIYKPIDAKQGEVEIRFYSPVTIEPPKSQGWFLTGTYHELQGDLQPFIVEISGSVKDYKWAGNPLVKITFPESVPDLGIRPVGFWDKNVLNPIKESLKETNFVFQKIFGKTSKVKEKIQGFGEGAVSNIEDALKAIKNNIENAWQKFKETVSQFNPFGATVGFFSGNKKTAALESSLNETETELEKLRKEISLLEEKLKNEEGLRAEQKEKYESEVSGLTGKVDSLAGMVDAFNAKISEISSKEKITQESNEQEKKEIEETEKTEEEIIICQRKEGDLPKRNKIIFNEIAWMGTTKSANDEWIELKNVSGKEINLNGWQILNKDQKIKIVFDIGQTYVKLNTLFLLERTSDETVPGIAADLIYTGALKNSDEALYLFDENCQLQDEVLASPDWPAGDKSSKRTMERKSDLSWQTSSNIGGTPKSQNSSGYYFFGGGGGGAPPPSYPKILISEIQIVPINERFIELYNPNNSSLSLTNWYIQRKTETATSWSSLVSSTKLEGKNIQPRSYFLIAKTNENADIILDLTLTENNSLVLKNPNGEIVDKVGWGTAQDFETSPFPQNPSENQSLGRKWNPGTQEYQDTDNNAIDFEIQTPTPKAENSVEVKPRQTPTQAILEVSPESLEFSAVESGLNPPSQTLLITNIGSGDLNWTGYVSPSVDGTDWLAMDPVSGTTSAGVSSQTSVSADISGLAEGIYTAKIIITAGEIEGSPKEIDVNLTVGPSPEEQPTKILITEVFFDAEGSDEGKEFVELYNPNNFKIDISGWSIQYLGPNATSVSEIKRKNFEEGNEINPKNYFLIGLNGRSGDLSWGQALGNSGGTIFLVNNQGPESNITGSDDENIVDRVGYGTGEGLLSEGTPVSLEGFVAGKSIGRKWNSQTQKYQDAGNNSVDFEIQTPTPKSKNQTVEEPGSPFEIVVSGADTVWNLHLITASADVIDSTDAPPQDLTVTFVSHSDTVWNSDWPAIPSDVIDSTDVLPQTLFEAFVSMGEALWNINLEESF